MNLRRILAGWWALAALAAGAGAHASTGPIPLMQSPPPAINLCAGTPLDVDFTNVKASCDASASYATFGALPGITLTPGTLSGGTQETAYDATGTLHYYASGAARTNNAGITVDVAGENYVTHSGDLANNGVWYANQSTIATTTSPGPDGSTSSAFTLTAGAGPGTIYPTLSLEVPIAASPSTEYTMSIACQAVTNTQCSVTPTTTTGSLGVLVTMSANGCVTSLVSGSGTTNNSSGQLWHADHGGWCEAWATFTTGAGDSTINPEFWIGDGSQGCTGSCLGTSINVFGVQVNQGPHHSYLPTTTVPSVFSGDVASLTNPSPSAPYTTVYFGPGQNSYQVTGSTINLVDTTAPWAGQPIGEVVVSNTLQEPVQARLAGYDTITWQVTRFTAANVDMGLTNAPGFDLYFYNFGGSTPTGANTTLNADGTITTANTGNTYNAELSSAVSLGGASWRGRSFGLGFYAEVSASYTRVAETTGGWVALWSNPIEAAAGLPSLLYGGAIQISNPGSIHYTEWDWMEDFLTQFGVAAGTNAYTALDWSSLGTANPTNVGQDALVPTSSLAFSQSFHRYGFRWIPATPTKNGEADWYLDGVAVFTRTWTLYNATIDQPPVTSGVSWLFGVADAQHPFFIAGSNPAVPLTIQWIRFWQLNANGDIWQ